MDNDLYAYLALIYIKKTRAHCESKVIFSQLARSSEEIAVEKNLYYWHRDRIAIADNWVLYPFPSPLPPLWFLPGLTQVCNQLHGVTYN